MSANATATATARIADRDTPCRMRIEAIVYACIPLCARVRNESRASSFYGFDYYKLSAIDRPFSPKHHMLRPSGPIGLYLGFLGVALFVGIFLYPIRKHWAWLGQMGKTRHWLDIHVLMGLTAPFIVAFHSTLKFRGIAGMAFWIMFAVSASGVVGRYLYAQIPRKVTTAELSMKELQELQERLSQQLAAQKLFRKPTCGRCCACPTRIAWPGCPSLSRLAYMMILDVIRMFRVARLRRHALSFGASL